MRTMLALSVLALAYAGCTGRRAPAQERTLFFRGAPAAQVEERVEDEGGGKRVSRRVRLPNGELADTDALLDASGFVREAHYRRADRRAVDLRGATLSDGSGARLALTAPVVAIDLLRHVNPQTPAIVTIVDLASGEAIAGRVERRGASVSLLDGHGGLIARCNVEGACTGPGAFFEGVPGDAPSLDTAPVDVALVATGPRRGLRLVGIDDARGALALDGPGQRAAAPGVVAFVDGAAAASGPPLPPADTRAPGLFIESADPRVKAFAFAHGSGADALADAVTIAAAVFALVDPGATDAPPSATEMLESGGDCDGAAALVTAAMRALGHAARPVVGYRFVAGRFVPHAWAEVYTPTAWVLIDGSMPKVGSDSQHLKLFDGLGSALTMGRVLGRLRLEPFTPIP